MSAAQSFTIEYTSSSTFPVNFDTPAIGLARWFQVVGAGTVVVTNEDGSTGTFVCGGGEIFSGGYRQLVSMTCTRVRMGNGQPPIPTGATPSSTAGTIGGVQMSVAPASAATPIAVGPNDPDLTRAGLEIFGDGSDGALAFDGIASVLGISPSSSVYTLTRDIFASSIAVSAGVTVNAAGFRVFCQGTCTVAATGVISCNGNAAAAGTAGAITNASGSLGAGTAGGAGGSGNNAGSAGTNHAVGFPAGTGAGGAGGGDGTHTAAAAGTYAALAASKGGARFLTALLLGMIFGTQTSGTASLVSLYMGGTGGGGGGGDDADATGGGGGGGGGVLVLASRTVVNNGTISCNGGAGAAGTSAAHNAGGGGGGGGGVCTVITRTYSGTGVQTAAGGAGGAKAGASGVAGSAGTAGVVILAYS